MRRSNAVLSALALISIAACTAASGAGKPDSAAVAADLAGIGKLRDAIMAAFKSEDVAAVTALYTSDGLTQPNGQPTGTGPDGLAAAYKGFFDQLNVASFVLTPVKTEASGNLGYEIGTYTFIATPKPKGDTIKENGRYMVVLRKGADGTWKTISDIDNLPTPPAPPPPAPKGKGK
jgi:ketosteroid isomerase-like protein